MKVAVIAHAEKTVGGGLPELRRSLEAAGVEEPLCYEAPKAKKPAAQVERALEEGAKLVFAWDGDGTVRRSIDVLAGTDATLAVIPAGTANLFATNLDIPRDIEEAIAVGLRGDRRVVDVGRFDDERFAVMAGAGFDTAMIRDADARTTWVAPPTSGAARANLRGEGFSTEIEVGGDCYESRSTCILLGNLGDIFGGIGVFPDARPDDGMLELGVVTAQGRLQWMGTLVRTAVGNPNRSPFVRTTKAKVVKVKLDRKLRYELDSGDRNKVRSFKVEVRRGRSTCKLRDATRRRRR